MPQAREGWRGAALVVLSLVGVALCVCGTAAFILSDRVPTTLDRYVPTRTGEAGLYRVTYGDGSSGFLTVNVVRPNADSLSYAAVFGQGGRAVQVNYRFTNWQGTGASYTRVDSLARRGDRLLLLAQQIPEQTVFVDPPIDISPAGLLRSSAEAPQEGETSMFDLPWTYRQWHDGQDEVTLPDGSTATADRFKLERYVRGSLVDQTLGWYVPGLGEVRYEETDGNGQRVMVIELMTSTRLDPEARPTLPLDALLSNDPADTALFREGPNRLGAWPDAALAGPDLKITYRRQSGVGVTASPAYADGLFYLADQNGQLVALDAYTATPRWQFTAGGPMVAAPAVAGGIVYVGAGDKILYALEARDGHYLWHRRLLDNVSTSPVVADGTVYVGAEDRTLYALDARTGALRWRFTAGDRIVSSPAVADGRVVFGADDGLVYALNAASGDLLWRYALDSAVEATPALTAAGLVFAASDGSQLAAIDAASGAARWTAETRFGYLASPAVGPARVYATDVGGGVHAYDTATGARAWEWFTPDDVGFVSSPLLIGQHLLGIDTKARLYVWDAATGMLLQTVSVGEAMTASPTWTGEAVLVANGAGELIALQGGPAARGVSWTPLWQHDYASAASQQNLFANPLLVDGTLYVAPRDGTLWAGAPETGAGQSVANFGDNVWATPVERAGTLYVTTLGGTVVAYDLAAHTERWSTTLGDTLRFSPAVDDARVYVHRLGSPNTVVSALDAGTGDVVWERRFSDGNSAPIREGDSLFVSGTALTALDPATGDVRWESEPLVSLGSLAAFDGVVYAGDSDGTNASFLAVDAATGETLWRREDAVRYIYSRPAFDTATATVLAGTQEGTLFAFAADSGEVRWRFQADAALQSSLQVRDGVVYFTSTTGNLYAVATASGRLLNHYRPGANLNTQAGPVLGTGVIFAAQGDTLYALTVDTP